VSDTTPPAPEQPLAVPGQADDAGPQIGVDEWVARSEDRLVAPRGVPERARRWIAGIPQWALLAVFVAMVALIPVLSSDEYILRVTADTMLYVLLAMGLNVAVGWAGILDLGYIAFYGFAAYLFAELSSPHYGIHWPTWASLPLVIVATILLGFLAALPTRRLSGDYLAIVTLFFGQIFVTFTIQGYRWNWLGFGAEHDITGGPTGLTQIDPFRLFGHQLTQVRDYIWVEIGGFLIIAIILTLANHSRTGRAWRSLRDDTLAAEVMSMPVNKLMLLAVAVGAGVAGLAGAINGAYYQGVFPSSFGFATLITVYAMVILGGAGSLPGVVAGAVLVNVLLEVLRTPEHARWVFYVAIIVGLLVKIRPWRVLAAVVGALVAFGLVVNAIVGAVWPRGTAGGMCTGTCTDLSDFVTHGWLAVALRHWLVLPKNTYEIADYQIGNYAFVILIGLVLALTVVKGWWRHILLVPTIWTAAFVWETRLIEESPTTRPLFLGVILIVLMAVRPHGLFGTPRVESV
jgi:ABC-type branched-subunit amino acid transport system permease subunit